MFQGARLKFERQGAQVGAYFLGIIYFTSQSTRMEAHNVSLDNAKSQVSAWMGNNMKLWLTDQCRTTYFLVAMLIVEDLLRVPASTLRRGILG